MRDANWPECRLAGFPPDSARSGPGARCSGDKRVRTLVCGRAHCVAGIIGEGARRRRRRSNIRDGMNADGLGRPRGAAPRAAEPEDHAAAGRAGVGGGASGGGGSGDAAAAEPAECNWFSRHYSEPPFLPEGHRERFQFCGADAGDAAHVRERLRRDGTLGLVRPADTHRDVPPLAVHTAGHHRQAQYEFQFGRSGAAGTALKKYEAISCHVPASLVNRQYYFPKDERQELERYVASWVLVALVAICVALVGFGMDQGVRAVYLAVYEAVQAAVIERSGSVFGGCLAFVALCAAFASVAGLLVVFVGPLAMGSGISEVKSYLNGTHIPGLFALNTFVAKALGVCFSIGSGLIAGREGPIIHVGAILGAAFSQGASKMLRFRLRRPRALQAFRSNEWKRDLAVMGSAFGVTVAFIAPLGGTLFAIEEGATHWRQQLTFYTFFGCLASAFIVGTLLQLANGITNPLVPLVDAGSYAPQTASIAFHLRDLPFVLLIGVLGGIVGALFAAVQWRLMRVRMRYLRGSGVRMGEVALTAALVALMRFWIPRWGGDCRSSADGVVATGLQGHTELNFSRFYCAPGEYNMWAAVIWNPLETALRVLLHSPGAGDVISVGLLFAAFAFYFGFTSWLYGIAVPGGIFIPSFLIGASYGRLVGLLQNYVFNDSDSLVLITSYAFIGSASALGGMTRVTISVAMIALEVTQNIGAAFYAFLAVIIAKLVADSFNVGIYDLTIVLRKIPFLVSDVSHEYVQTRAEDMMHRDVAKLRAVSTVAEIIETLCQRPHHAFPVVDDDDDSLVGVVFRYDVLRLLENERFGVGAPLLSREHTDSAWPNGNNVRLLDEVSFFANIDAKHRAEVVDLRPYTDAEAPIISASAPLTAAHRYLRDGGFRHVLVAARGSIRVDGVLVRQDIMPGVVKRALLRRRAYLGDDWRMHMARNSMANDKVGDGGSVDEDGVADAGAPADRDADASGRAEERVPHHDAPATADDSLEPFETPFWRSVLNVLGEARRERAQKRHRQQQRRN